MTNISDKSCRENQNTHFVLNNFFLNRGFYKIMWKNIVVSGRPQMTIWRMRITCWITKATKTYSNYVILIAFPLQQWLHERATLLRYTYIIRLVHFFSHLSVLLPTRSLSDLTVRTFVGLSIWQYVRLSVCPFDSTYVCRPVHLTVRTFVGLSIWQYVHLSVSIWQYVHLSVCPFCVFCLHLYLPSTNSFLSYQKAIRKSQKHGPPTRGLSCSIIRSAAIFVFYVYTITVTR